MKSIPAPDHSALDQTSVSRPRRTLNRRAPAPLALEPRIMFDGATADAAVAAARAAADVVVPEAREAAGAEKAASFAPQDLQVAAAVLPPDSQRQEIVFVVDNVPDYQKLVAAVQPGIEVVVLDHTRDGLQQMIAALDGRAPVDAVHLVTHGDSGRIELGATAIADATLQRHADALAAFGTKLAAGADLLVYGCDVAAGAGGQAFIDRLGQLTGADVAASTDVTGSAAFGNWTLEARSGAIETSALAFEGAGWTGRLETQTVFNANWQVLKFNNIAAADVNKGTNNGDQVRFQSVIEIDGQQIDAVITTSKTTSATINTYDSPSSPISNNANAFQPLMTINANGSATFTIAFFKAGTTDAVTLQQVVVNSWDIDASGTNAADRQYQSFKGFDRYELSTSTELASEVNGNGSVTFVYNPGAGGAKNNQDQTADAYRVRVYYESMSTFEVTAGVRNGGSNTAAHFSFDFLEGSWKGGYTEFKNPAPVLEYDSTVVRETASNDGAVSSVSISLSGQFVGGVPAKFAAGVDGKLTDVTVTGVPAGLQAEVQRVSDTEARLVFTGKAAAHEQIDSSNFRVKFGNGAFAGGNLASAVTGADRSDLRIVFDSAPVDNTPPVVAANQRFEYAENRAAGAGAIGTVQASDAGGTVSDFRFVNGGLYTQTSADGYFSIDSSGRISLTSAGRAAGAASNDFETGANTFRHDVVAYDANNNRSTAVEVVLALTNVNEAPTAGNASITTAEDTIKSGSLPAAADPEGDTVTYSKASNPAHGTVVIDPSGTYLYTPAPNYNGADSFTYTVSDGNGGSNTYTMSITVSAVNDAPAASNTSIVLNEDGSKTGSLPAAIDVDGDTVTYGVASGAAHGTLVINTNGSYTYTPAPDYNGADSFSYTVSDGKGGSNTYTVSVTVNPVDDLPIAANGSLVTNEDSPRTGTLPAASHGDGAAVSYALAAGGAAGHGQVAITASGSYTYTPDPDFSGADSFQYTVSDGKGGSNTYTMSVTVMPVNDAPTASNTAVELDEDGVKEGSLPAATDVDGDPVSYTLAGTPLHGELVLGTNGSYTYSPDRDFHGADSFQYTVSDGKGGSNTYTVSITVKPVNDGPVAANGNVTLDEDTPKEGQLPAATDAEGDPFEYALAPNGAPAHGSIDVKADGSYLYTPDANFHGADSFQYTVSDGKGGSNTYTMNVTVAPVNDLPTASNAEVAVDEDTPFSGTLPPAQDMENDPVTYAKASDPAHGSVSVDADGKFTYTPNLDYNGSDSFTYTVSDGKGTSVAYTVTLTVGAGNDAPVALDTAIVTDEDRTATGTLPVARDPDGDVPVYALAGAAAHGQVTIDADGKYSYTPAANYYGADSFSYKVSDGKGGSNTYTVTVTVKPVNDAPTASDTRISTVEEQSVTGKLPPARDVEGQPITYAKGSEPAHGSVTIDARGNYTYTPQPDFSGTDRFTYTVSDGAASNTYTVTVEVGAHNDAPVAADGALVTAEDTPYSGALPAASDADGDRVSYALSGAPAHGNVAIGADGRYTYTPAADFHGKDSFRYTISDGNGGSASYTVEVTVTPVNDAPVPGGNGEGRGIVGQPLAPISIPAFTDVDSPSIGYTATLPGGAPLPSWLAFDPDTRTVSGTPPAGSSGNWTVVVTGSDGSLSGTATVRIEVRDPAAPAQAVTIDAMSKDTGRSATDFITSDGSAGRTVNGSIGAPLGANEVVQVSFDGGATWQQASTSGGKWSAVDGGAHGGDWTIVARVTNTAAGVSGAAASVGVVLDTTRPTAPTVDTAAGASTTPVLGGTATVGPGETLQVSVNGKDYLVTPVDGRWTLDLAGKDAGLIPGQSYPVTALVIDPAGNVRSGDGSVRVDALPVPELPPVPVAPPAPPASLVPAALPEAVVQAAPQPTPVRQAVDTRVNSELAAPGSLVGNDNTALYGGIGTRATPDSPALDLRGAALSDIYTRSDGFRTVVAKADEPALVLFQGVPDQFAESGRTLSLSVPADAFVHTQDRAIVRLAALMQDGQPLPNWVQFNGETGKFSGEVPKGWKGELKIKVIARDQAGREAVALFRINVGEERSTTVEKAPAGKPDLSAQLRASGNRALLRRA